MLHDRDEALREALRKSDESKEKLFESWIIDSEEGANLEDQARHTNWEDEGESCEDGCCGDSCE